MNKCKFPFCKSNAVKCTNCSDNDVPIRCLCIRHHLMLRSGRVGTNYKRDWHRQYLKGYSEHPKSNVTWKTVYDEVKRLYPKINRYKAIKATTRLFEANHKDGNHSNNNLKNIETLYVIEHKLVSSFNGHYNRHR